MKSPKKQAVSADHCRWRSPIYTGTNADVLSRLLKNPFKHPEQFADVRNQSAGRVELHLGNIQAVELPNLGARHASEDRAGLAVAFVEYPRGHHLGDALAQARVDILFLGFDQRDDRRAYDR